MMFTAYEDRLVQHLEKLEMLIERQIQDCSDDDSYHGDGEGWSPDEGEMSD